MPRSQNRPRALLLASLLLSAGSAAAQTPPASQPSRALSVDDALRLAAQHDPRLAGAVAQHERREAEAVGARGRLLPRLDFEQSLTRGDHPVYAFGTRLLQGRFAATDLALPSLNSPDAITDHSSRLALRVPLVHAEGWFGARAARQMTRTAEADLEHAQLALTADVVRAYHGAQLAAQAAEVATEAAAAASLEAARVRSMLRNEMATELDALAMEVHVATLEQRAIVARGEAAMALAALNQAVGLPIGAPTSLTDAPSREVGGAEAQALDVDALPLTEHPAVRRAQAAEAAAQAAHRAARARYAPVLAAAADIQTHRSALIDGQHGESWTVGVVLQLNLFNGLQDMAYERAAAADLRASRVSALHAESAVRLQIQRAQVALEAAAAAVEVSARAVELARAAHALEQQRSERGMTDTASLVRAHTAQVEAELRHLSAQHSRDMARVDLAVALGTNPIDSQEVSP